MNPKTRASSGVIIEPMVIEVHGVPDEVPHDRMVDQLKIHFLKRRNSGGDVLMVIYPTSTPCQAYVIFESNEVTGVLEFTHILEVNNKFYPLCVKAARLSEVDMPVETTLDLSWFSRTEEVQKLINLHGFTKNELRAGVLLLKGSFLKLKLLRDRLIRLHGYNLQTHSSSTAGPTNGFSLITQREPHSLEPKIASTSKSKYGYFLGDDKFDSGPASYKDLGSRNSHSTQSYSSCSRPPGYHDNFNYGVTQHQQASSSALSSGFSMANQIEPHSLDPRIASKTTLSNEYGMGSVENNNVSPSSYRDSVSSGSHRTSLGSHSYSTRERSSVGNSDISNYRVTQASSLASSSGTSLVSQIEAFDHLDHRIASKTTSRHGCTIGSEEDTYSQSFLDENVLSSFKDKTRIHHSTYSSTTQRMQSLTKDTYTPKYSERQEVMGSEVLGQRHTVVEGTSSLSDISLSKFSMTQPMSSLYKGLDSGGSPRSLSRLNSNTLASSSSSSPSSHSQRLSRFVVDTDTLNFILTQKEDIISFIEETYCTVMSVKGNAELTTVSFSGTNAEKAQECLLATMNDIGATLRTQTINLNKYNKADQMQICAKIKHYKDSGVLIKLDNDVVKLVGSSAQSFVIKQNLLELDSKTQAITMEHNSKFRRSSSVPRHHKIPDQGHSPDPEQKASAANKYHPSQYQEKTDAENTSQVTRGRPQFKNNFHQRRTHSQSQQKIEATVQQSNLQDISLPPSSKGKKSPKILKNFVIKSAGEFKTKLQQNKSAQNV